MCSHGVDLTFPPKRAGSSVWTRERGQLQPHRSEIDRISTAYRFTCSRGCCDLQGFIPLKMEYHRRNVYMSTSCPLPYMNTLLPASSNNSDYAWPENNPVCQVSTATTFEKTQIGSQNMFERPSSQSNCQLQNYWPKPYPLDVASTCFSLYWKTVEITLIGITELIP